VHIGNTKIYEQLTEEYPDIEIVYYD